MKNTDEKKTEIVTLRLRPSFKKQLEKQAKDGFRSVSQEAERLIVKAIEKGL